MSFCPCCRKILGPILGPTHEDMCRVFLRRGLPRGLAERVMPFLWTCPHTLLACLYESAGQNPKDAMQMVLPDHTVVHILPTSGVLDRQIEVVNLYAVNVATTPISVVNSMAPNPSHIMMPGEIRQWAELNIDSAGMHYFRYHPEGFGQFGRNFGRFEIDDNGDLALTARDDSGHHETWAMRHQGAQFRVSLT